MNERALAIAFGLPEIGAWFRLAEGKTFEVVAVDEKDLTVEIQHFDGTVEELDVDTLDLPESEEKHQDFPDPLNFVDGYES